MRDARWLDALDEVERSPPQEESELVNEVKEIGGRFREARKVCGDDGGSWEAGYSYLGTETSFKYDEKGQLWLKTEGDMVDIDLFYTVSVLREVELFGEWVPFMRSVSVLKQVDYSRLCTHFSVGVRGILVRDCVLRVSACNNALSDGSLYFEGASPSGEEWRGTQLPERYQGFAYDRMEVVALHARIQFIGPNSQHCKIVCAVDLRLSVPRSLLDFFLKRLVGVFLILWRRHSRQVANNPECKHRQAIEADTDFYRDFLYPKYLEFLDKQGWKHENVASTVTGEPKSSESLKTPPVSE